MKIILVVTFTMGTHIDTQKTNGVLTSEPLNLVIKHAPDSGGGYMAL